MSLIVDSYAWFEYFKGNKLYAEVIEKNELKTPSIVVAEVSRVLARKGMSLERISEATGVILEKSIVLPLDFTQAAKTGEISIKEGLNFADAVIYGYASENEKVLTGDQHFKGKKNVLFVK